MPVSKVGILGFSYICRPTHTFRSTLLSAHHSHPTVNHLSFQPHQYHKYRTGGKGQPYISRQLSIHRIAKLTGFSFPDRSSKMSHDWENAPEPFGCIKSSCHQLFMETVLLTPCLKMLTRHDPDRVRMWVSGNKG